jgi:hypothetical protein
MKLSDGAVFNPFGYRLIIRYRKFKSRPFEVIYGEFFRGIHWCKLSVYIFHR